MKASGIAHRAAIYVAAWFKKPAEHPSRLGPATDLDPFGQLYEAPSAFGAADVDDDLQQALEEAPK